MSKQATVRPCVCDTCTHKDICKHTDALRKLEADLKLEEPFEVNCKKKTTTPWPTTTPYVPGNPGITWRDLPNTFKSNAICKSCGFMIDGVCQAPNNMAGLPCQQVYCQATSEVETQKRELPSVSTTKLCHGNL